MYIRRLFFFSLVFIGFSVFSAPKVMACAFQASGDYVCGGGGGIQSAVGTVTPGNAGNFFSSTLTTNAALGAGVPIFQNSGQALNSLVITVRGVPYTVAQVQQRFDQVVNQVNSLPPYLRDYYLANVLPNLSFDDLIGSTGLPGFNIYNNLYGGFNCDPQNITVQCGIIASGLIGGIGGIVMP